MARNEAQANQLMFETARMRRYGLTVGRNALTPSRGVRRSVARRGLLARLFGL